mmetsp:Transcript_19258/g.31609  ORF Transcript_19258/g.31609 Transcript_19258/m.31609 type:complete len:121 (+) Transcript_19258:422-784(+)
MGTIQMIQKVQLDSIVLTKREINIRDNRLTIIVNTAVEISVLSKSKVIIQCGAHHNFTTCSDLHDIQDATNNYIIPERNHRDYLLKITHQHEMSQEKNTLAVRLLQKGNSRNMHISTKLL